MASLNSGTVTVNVVDERVEIALRVLQFGEENELADEARKFLLATLKDWNGAQVDSEVIVCINGEEKLQRWTKGDQSGGISPSREDASAAINALEEALNNARLMTRTNPYSMSPDDQ